MEKKELEKLASLSPYAETTHCAGWHVSLELHNGNVYVLIFWNGRLMKIEEAPKALRKKLPVILTLICRIGNKRFYPVMAAFLIAITVFAQEPVLAKDLGDVKALIKAKQALSENSESVYAHRLYQDLLLKDGWRKQLLEEYSKRIAEKGKTAENLYLLARLQDMDEQEESFRKIVDEFPQFAWGYYGLGGSYEDKNDYKKAIKFYEKAVSLDNKHVPAYQQLAVSYTETEGMEKAVEILEQGLSQVPGNAGLLSYHGYYLRILKKYAPALKSLQEALQQEPEHETALRQLGFLYTDQGKHDEAIKARKKYLELWPGDGNSWYQLGVNYMSLYDKDKEITNLTFALQCFDKVTENIKDNPDTYYSLIDYFSGRGWDAHSLYYNQKAIELTLPEAKTYSSLEHNISWIPANKMGTSSYQIEAIIPKDYIRAPADLSDDEQKIFKDIVSEQVWLALAKAMGKSAKPEMDDLDKFINQYPQLSISYYNRGILKLWSYKKKESIDDFEKAVSLMPHWAREYNALAVSTMLQKDYETARQALKKAKGLAPDNLSIRYHVRLMHIFDQAVVGGTVKQLREIAAGVKAGTGINLDTFEVFVLPFERYLDRDPTSPEIYEAFGDIFTDSPNSAYWKSALQYYQKAIKLGGNFDRLTEKIAEINKEKK